MSKQSILLSNDDGGQSPFVEPFAAALAALPKCEELRLVFPAEEQSWIAQAVTRFRPLSVERHRFRTQEGFLVNGTPADCVGLGIDHLFHGRPDFVVSGINVGTNATLPFYLSSGTVGAARQGFCFGLRSIAVSAIVPAKAFHACREHDIEEIARYELDWQRISLNSARLVERLLSADVWSGVDLYSVNVPWELSADTPIEITSLERARYLNLYNKRSDTRYDHHFRGFDRTKEAAGTLPNDLAVIEAGAVSITPIRYDLTPSAELLSRLKTSLAKSC